MSDMNDAITIALAKKVMKNLDLDAMAEEIRPQVRATVMKGVLDGIKYVEWGELVSEIFYDQSDLIKDIVLKALNITIPEKKSRR